MVQTGKIPMLSYTILIGIFSLQIFFKIVMTFLNETCKWGGCKHCWALYT